MNWYFYGATLVATICYFLLYDRTPLRALVLLVKTGAQNEKHGFSNQMFMARISVPLSALLLIASPLTASALLVWSLYHYGKAGKVPSLISDTKMRELEAAA